MSNRIETVNADSISGDLGLQSDIDDLDDKINATSNTLAIADSNLNNYVSSVNDDSVVRDDNLTTLINTEVTNLLDSITAERLDRILADSTETAARIQGDDDLSTDVYNSMAALSNSFFNEYSATLESDFTGYASGMVQQVISDQGGISNLIERGASGDAEVTLYLD